MGSPKAVCRERVRVEQGSWNTSSRGPHAMSRKLRVAVRQMTSVNSHKRNLGVVMQLAQRAASRDCRMLFLPEACAFLGLSSSETVSNALDLTQSEVVDDFKAICRRYSLWMNFGCHEKSGDAEDSRAYNTQVMMDSE